MIKINIKKTISLLILGFILGSIVTLSLSGYRIEKLYQEREQLKVDLFETKERLSKLEEMWESKSEGFIREVRIELKMDNNTFTELALKQSIQETVKDLVGEKINTINPYIIINIIDGRIITADDKKYRLDLEAVFLSEILAFYIKPILITETPEG